MYEMPSEDMKWLCQKPHSGVTKPWRSLQSEEDKNTQGAPHSGPISFWGHVSRRTLIGHWLMKLSYSDNNVRPKPAAQCWTHKDGKIDSHCCVSGLLLFDFDLRDVLCKHRNKVSCLSFHPIGSRPTLQGCRVCVRDATHWASVSLQKR